MYKEQKFISYSSGCRDVQDQAVNIWHLERTLPCPHMVERVRTNAMKAVFSRGTRAKKGLQVPFYSDIILSCPQDLSTSFQLDWFVS
jgi:hypothetical protein